jgi:long-chain fatty acid transport protein
MFNRRFPSPLLLLLVAGVLSQPALASGFQLREQSAPLLGTAFAGASAGQDLSSVFFNPATLSLFPGTQVEANASWIGVYMDLKGAAATRAPAFHASNQPIAGPTDLPNAVNQPVVPALYASWALNATWSLGFSLNAPFGLVTNYPDNFVGRYYGLKTDLKTIDIAPILSYRANQAWTFGVAFVARKADATISQAMDFGAIGNDKAIPGMTPGGNDGLATLTGNCWAYGYKLGTTYQYSDTLRFGLGYQSAATLKINGQVAYAGVPAVLAPTFAPGGAKTEVNLPATGSLGFTWEATKAFSLQGEAAWTGWSTFKELRLRFDGGAIPDSVTVEHWSNTWFLSLGGIYKVKPGLALKAGLGHDQTPVGDGHRTPRIPDADRTWLSLGAAWAMSPATTLDVGWTRIIGKTADLNLKSGSAPDADNFFRGNLTGSYDVGANILAASLRFKF